MRKVGRGEGSPASGDRADRREETGRERDRDRQRIIERGRKRQEVGKAHVAKVYLRCS